jgi:hypothetical protein
MSVAARFYVAEITQSAHGPKGAAAVKLQAVSRGDQNRQWAEATPSGTITMQINAAEAAAWFFGRLGEDVSVLFEAAPIAVPGDGHPYRASEAAPGTYYAAPKCGDCLGAKEDHAGEAG